MARELVTTGR
jgi:ribosome-associated protein